mgnify:FL=1
MYFILDRKVFLGVRHSSTTLFLGNSAKLAPLFCEPFIVLNCIGSSTYHVNLPIGIKVYVFFHVILMIILITLRICHPNLKDGDIS